MKYCKRNPKIVKNSNKEEIKTNCFDSFTKTKCRNFCSKESHIKGELPKCLETGKWSPSPECGKLLKLCIFSHYYN